MDSLTHLTLGACTGELLLGKKLGKKAMLFGALAANIPDVDTVTGLFVQSDKALLIHRGITHSFFFALVAGILLGWLAKLFFSGVPLRQLAFFFCFQLGLHDLLDTCTSYGTGLLEPFSHQRFSFHLLYVADPLFTIWLLIAAILLLIMKTSNLNRTRWAAAGIVMSLLYVCFAIRNKVLVNERSAASFTTPAPFNTMLWYCIKKTDEGYYTGYSSVFDRVAVSYEYHPRNDTALKQPEPYLKTFADGYYTISTANNDVYLNIIRFGQIMGWQTKDAPFALSYPVNSNANQNMIIQKGRLAGWNKKSIRRYLERIAGR